MNKVLLSLVVVVGLAGGAYVMLPADNDLNLMQYIPAPIADFLDLDKKEVEVVESEIVESPDTQVFINETPPQEKTISTEDVVVTPDEVVEQNQEIVKEKEVVKEEEEVKVTPVTLAEAPQEEKNESGDIVSESLNARELISKNKNSATNRSEIEKQLQEMIASISKLDGENQTLQMKFKQMLQKNKELAMKLSQLEQQISTIN